MPSQRIFATAQDAEAAFYEALEQCDTDAMMAVWAEDEDVTCIHPGGPRLVGYATIREAWRSIFSNGMRLKLRLSQTTSVSTPFAVITTVLEHFSTPNDQSVAAPIVATNVYVRGAAGWRMVAHHASPMPPMDSGADPRILH